MSNKAPILSFQDNDSEGNSTSSQQGKKAKGIIYRSITKGIHRECKTVGISICNQIEPE